MATSTKSLIKVQGRALHVYEAIVKAFGLSDGIGSALFTLFLYSIGKAALTSNIARKSLRKYRLPYDEYERNVEAGRVILSYVFVETFSILLREKNRKLTSESIVNLARQVAARYTEKEAAKLLFPADFSPEFDLDDISYLDSRYLYISPETMVGSEKIQLLGAALYVPLVTAVKRIKNRYGSSEKYYRYALASVLLVEAVLFIGEMNVWRFLDISKKTFFTRRKAVVDAVRKALDGVSSLDELVPEVITDYVKDLIYHTGRMAHEPTVDDGALIEYLKYKSITAIVDKEKDKIASSDTWLDIIEANLCAT